MALLPTLYYWPKFGSEWLVNSAQKRSVAKSATLGQGVTLTCWWEVALCYPEELVAISFGGLSTNPLKCKISSPLLKLISARELMRLPSNPVVWDDACSLVLVDPEPPSSSAVWSWSGYGGPVSAKQFGCMELMRRETSLLPFLMFTLSN